MESVTSGRSHHAKSFELSGSSFNLRIGTQGLRPIGKRNVAVQDLIPIVPVSYLRVGRATMRDLTPFVPSIPVLLIL